MRTALLIQRINDLIDSMNPKQQSIARQLILDKTYDFSVNHIRNVDEIYLINKSTGESYHFLTFVKNKCNCE